MKIEKLKSKFFTGAWITDVKQYFNKINEIIDYIKYENYLIYKTYLFQTGTDAPVSVDLTETLKAPIKDTINGIWTYNSPGSYTYTQQGLCSDPSKIFINISPSSRKPNVIFYTV